jgi:hypothetical protein
MPEATAWDGFNVKKSVGGTAILGQPPIFIIKIFFWSLQMGIYTNQLESFYVLSVPKGV